MALITEVCWRMKSCQRAMEHQATLLSGLLSPNRILALLTASGVPQLIPLPLIFVASTHLSRRQTLIESSF